MNVVLNYQSYKSLLLNLLLVYVGGLIKTGWGCLNKPYETYRALSLYRYELNLLAIAAATFIYGVFAAVAKYGLLFGIIHFSKSFFYSVTLFMMTFWFAVTSIYVVGKLFKGEGSLSKIIVLWSFSLLPTLVWFFGSAFLYMLIPPPRTISWYGQIFSVIFIAFSIGCLMWKGILYYLTLRFGMRLDALRIAFISAIILPLWTIYSVALYKFGIFKVPFI